jgi:hypothetical protein
MADEQKSDFKRQTAYKCNIGDLNKGVFVKRPGWESSYLMTDYGDFSRVNIVAVIVNKDENSITIDDGTGQIVARVFDKPELLANISIGNPILIIARPREYNNRIYLTIDLIKKINDTGWIAYRKKELSLIQKVRDTVRPDIKKDAEIVESTSTMGSKERIITLIKELDNGEGADIDEIIRFSKIKNAEELIQDFILRGEVFEIRPGKIKLM